MDSGIYSLDTVRLCRWQILLGLQPLLVGSMEGFDREVEEQQLLKQKRWVWERHCCEASGNKSILLSDSIWCCRWTRSSTYSNHPAVNMKLNVAIDLNPISQIPNTRTRFRKLMRVCFLQFWNCFSQSVNSFPQVTKWDEGKQVKESIQQQAGTPQPQTTVSKRAINEESLVSLIPRGWWKNTDYRGKFITKKTTAGVLLLSSPCLQPESQIWDLQHWRCTNT